MDFVILDERDVWWQPAIEAAKRRGYNAWRMKRGYNPHLMTGPGFGFIRPHADPEILAQNQKDYYAMRDSCLTMIQDQNQMAVYEDKSMQAQLWSAMMPKTQRFARREDALAAIGSFGDTVVSKADEGASSENIRILVGQEAQRRHIEQVFTRGIPVNCCAGGATVVQNDYALLQEFIPHEITWRVNVVGTKFAAFKRYCYKDRMVAQTGNTLPVLEMDAEVESLFDFARKVFSAIDTRWCAIDVLKSGNEWKLLETSLAWPWPGVGKQAPFFGTSRHWGEMWEVMFDEIEAGVWQC